MVARIYRGERQRRTLGCNKHRPRILSILEGMSDLETFAIGNSLLIVDPNHLVQRFSLVESIVELDDLGMNNLDATFISPFYDGESDIPASLRNSK